MTTGTDLIHRLDDDTALERAVAHLASVLGRKDVPPVHWDPDHHLQGHLVIGDEELVLIAVRTTDHTPIVLSEAEWDAFHRRGATPAA